MKRNFSLHDIHEMVFLSPRAHGISWDGFCPAVPHEIYEIVFLLPLAHGMRDLFSLSPYAHDIHEMVFLLPRAHGISWDGFSLAARSWNARAVFYLAARPWNIMNGFCLAVHHDIHGIVFLLPLAHGMCDLFFWSRCTPMEYHDMDFVLPYLMTFMGSFFYCRSLMKCVHVAFLSGMRIFFSRIMKRCRSFIIMRRNFSRYGILDAARYEILSPPRP